MGLKTQVCSSSSELGNYAIILESHLLTSLDLYPVAKAKDI